MPLFKTPTVSIRYTIAGTYDPDTTPPEIDGHTITLGTAVNTGGNDTQVWRFGDGKITVPRAGGSRWSDSDGATWDGSPPSGKASPGPLYGGYKQAIYIGDRIYNLQRTASLSGGSPKYQVAYQYSDNEWVDLVPAVATVDTPNYVQLVNDAGGTEAGPLFHHKMLHCKDGRLMALIYGCTSADLEPQDGYPREHAPKKWRMEAVFSEIGNRGQDWGSPVPIMSTARGMLTRGTNPNSGIFSVAPAPWAVQEGAGEGTVIRRKNSDLWCFARTGGRQAGSATVGKFPIYPTPMLMSISADEGRSWEVPRQIPTSPLYAARHGNNPNAVTLGNGVTILTYGGPGGGWICFARPGAEPLFEGFFQIATSDSYTDIIKIGYNKALVFYFSGGSLTCRPITVDADGESGDPLIEVEPGPYKVAAGQQSRFAIWAQSLSSLKLFGGQYENGGAGTAVSAASRSFKTGALTSTTTFRVEANGGAVSEEVTIEVV